jgi:hypothetical protein
MPYERVTLKANYRAHRTLPRQNIASFLFFNILIYFAK